MLLNPRPGLRMLEHLVSQRRMSIEDWPESTQARSSLAARSNSSQPSGIVLTPKRVVDITNLAGLSVSQFLRNTAISGVVPTHQEIVQSLYIQICHHACSIAMRQKRDPAP